jgi:hypothetical protein
LPVNDLSNTLVYLPGFLPLPPTVLVCNLNLALEDFGICLDRSQ